MCGIFGQFSKSEQLLKLEELCGFTQMLSHRGPDGGAYWINPNFFFGHRRLSIIDISDGGTQPMLNEEKTFAITFNGEIYNFIELKAELQTKGHQFKSTSDTEVILKGFQEWGTDLPSKLIGMFAFAIADLKNKQLFLARDRFGEKPLFYYESSDNLFFASELKALAFIPQRSKSIDTFALAQYFCLNYVPGEATLFENIKKFKPGTWMLFDGSNKTVESYWSPEKDLTDLIQPEDLPAEASAQAGKTKSLTKQLQQKIDDSVKISLRSDVPVSLFLSGGIDSSLVAESAVRQGYLGKAYCLDFEESSYSEWERASYIAKKLGIPLERVVLDQSVLDDSEKIMAHMDDPLGDSSAFPVWRLSSVVAKDFKVALTGDGGDELFGGYLTYPASLMHQKYMTKLPGFFRSSLAHLSNFIPVNEGKVTFSYKLARFLRAADLPSHQAHLTWNGTWLPKKSKSFFTSTFSPKNSAYLDRIGKGSSLSELQRMDMSNYLPSDILTKVDRITMAHGLESRAPLLHPDIAKFAMSLSDGQRIDSKFTTKKILRDLNKELFGASISQAKKQGFSIPVHQWLRSAKGREMAEDLLSVNFIKQLEMFDTKAIEQVKTDFFIKKKPLGFELWGLLVLMSWFRNYYLNQPTTSIISKNWEKLRPVEVN